jgi:hypothetical protein
MISIVNEVMTIDQALFELNHLMDYFDRCDKEKVLRCHINQSKHQKLYFQSKKGTFYLPVALSELFNINHSSPNFFLSLRFKIPLKNNISWPFSPGENY